MADVLLETHGLEGLILSGGNSLQSLHPRSDNVAPERDYFENALLVAAIRRKIPVLGVCRGMQIINCHFGGTLQRVSNHVAVNHELIHAGKRKIFALPNVVNSFHEWGIPQNSLAKCLLPIAFDHDGNVEAFMHEAQSVTGIMWHPERTDPFSQIDTNLLKEIFL
jgi:putative glutamine amidotransferase